MGLHHDLCKLIQDKDNELQLMRGVKRSMEKKEYEEDDHQNEEALEKQESETEGGDARELDG